MSANTISIIRGVIMAIAVLFAQNVIPTGIDGGGKRVSDGLMVLAVSLAAGQKNDEATK